MEQKQKDALWAQYSKQTHVLGRVLSILTVALLGAPFVIGGLLGAYPDLGATARGFYPSASCGRSAALRNF